MLTVHNLAKSYDITPLWRQVTFSVNPGERVGLVGPNGCGKSTLLRIIAGQETADSGHITFMPTNIRLGYLTQGFEPDPHQTLPQFLQQFTGDAAQLEAKLTELATALAENPADTALQQAYDATLHQLTQQDTHTIAAYLQQFELERVDDNLPIGRFSGGQKSRLGLLSILLRDPELLLLDEPTNHLDIAMLEWLEQWLRQYAGAVLLVSHDRTFLDHTVNRILYMDPHEQTVRAYEGNYTQFATAVQHEHEKQWQTYKDQEYEIRRMKQDIARTREQSMSVERSTTPRQPNVRRIAKKVMKKAKSREKKLDRYLESEERVEKPARSWQMKLDLPEPPHMGKDVVILDELAVGYAGFPPLLTGLTEHIVAGTRLIITGPNGRGKTTLLRTLAGQLPPLAGSYRLGHNVLIGYMSQEQELLNPDQSALQTIQTIVPMNDTDARTFLHHFLFSGDDALRPCGQLSYGERARLMLATFVVQGCNLLLLDEPINHLDIPSRMRFEQALAQFDGAIIAVVHDRYFIEQFATAVWVIGESGIEKQWLA